MIKKLFGLLIIIFAIYAAREGYFFWLARNMLPVNTTIAGVVVDGLSLEEAGRKVAQVYAHPIGLTNARADERIELTPRELGFVLDLDTMLAETEEARAAQEWWLSYLGFLLRQPLAPIDVELRATTDPAQIIAMTKLAAELMDNPALPPRVEPDTLRFIDGEPGYITDIDATAATITTALFQLDPALRNVEATVIDQTAPTFDFGLLRTVLLGLLDGHPGLIGSVFVKDLQTGEEISINGDLAVSGMSIVKIAILLETYRVISVPSFDEQKLINETGIFSGNYSANLLLDVVAGMDNAYLGVDILTTSMERLGLINTFITTPYEEPPRPERPTVSTPANSVADLPTDPDPNMQTTAEDMGSLLTMIYDCSRGGGALLALYPDQLTPDECQALLDVLVLNTEGNLIRFGVPHGTPVAHKHGWATNTHGDAGVVYTPGGDYVIVTYLTEPNTDWLVAEYSFPILREMSQIVYNYFNVDDPYIGEAIWEAERFPGEVLPERPGANSDAESGDAPNIIIGRPSPPSFLSDDAQDETQPADATTSE